MPVPIEDAVIWTNRETRVVMVRPHAWGCPEDHEDRRVGHWCDPIGAAYTAWHKTKPEVRLLLMLETAIDLAMQGFSLGDVLRAFAEVPEFRALGSKSYPMCRALTKGSRRTMPGTHHNGL
jgi:hypothetical protein